MKILITGACGFVGMRVARYLANAFAGSGRPLELLGIDNFSRPGSESNRNEFSKIGGRLFHGDLRMASDLEAIPTVDWLIDAAANPSVLAGVDGRTSSRQIIQHNLEATVNMLEYCKTHAAGFALISTSRVYSISALSQIPIVEHKDGYAVNSFEDLPQGLSADGIAETFSTQAPISLYGSSKLAAETLAVEYGAAFDFPVWINRCGILAGAGQFGRPDQGILSYWINSYCQQKPLRYIGFNGLGYQTRDCLHPDDLSALLIQQMDSNDSSHDRVFNLGGGVDSSFSLAQLSSWCAERYGYREIDSDPVQRQFDIPWLVMDSSKARQRWGWSPQISGQQIFEEIATHADVNANWLKVSAA